MCRWNIGKMTRYIVCLSEEFIEKQVEELTKTCS
jgi:hypothetical protein